MGEGVLTLAIEVSNPSAASGGSGPGVAVGWWPGSPSRGCEVQLREVLHKDTRLGEPCHREPCHREPCHLLGVEMLRSERRHDDDLMPAIDRLWSRLVGEGVVADKQEIGRVVVSVGPGGYTGLRVAVVAGKMIAEAVGAVCVGVPSAWVVARRAAGDLPVPFGVALASKKDESVVTVFEGPVARLSEPGVGRRSEPGGAHEGGCVIGAEGLEALGVRGLIADRFLPESMRERCGELGIRIDAPVFDPVACLEASGAFEEVAPVELVPMYGREPEAVRKWRELHG